MCDKKRGKDLRSDELMSIVGQTCAAHAMATQSVILPGVAEGDVRSLPGISDAIEALDAFKMRVRSEAETTPAGRDLEISMKG